MLIEHEKSEIADLSLYIYVERESVGEGDITHITHITTHIQVASRQQPPAPVALRLRGRVKEARIYNHSIFGPFDDHFDALFSYICLTCILQALLDLFFDPLEIVQFQGGPIIVIMYNKLYNVHDRGKA